MLWPTTKTICNNLSYSWNTSFGGKVCGLHKAVSGDVAAAVDSNDFTFPEFIENIFISTLFFALESNPHR